MTVHYKRNRSPAYCYDMDTSYLEKAESVGRTRGPFESCGDCRYASHGFFCYGCEGDCLKTDMDKISKRRNQVCK